MKAAVAEPRSSSSKVAVAMTLDRAAEMFASFSNRTRVDILLRLTKREWSVNELASDLAISQSALSQHLAKLRHAKLVSVRRHKQTVFYKCDDKLVAEVLNLLGLKG